MFADGNSAGRTKIVRQKKVEKDKGSRILRKGGWIQAEEEEERVCTNLASVDISW